jgi:acetoin utilization deacetylase AcuC-like enzyme
VGAAHAFDTTRKSRWVRDSLIESPIPGLSLAAPAPLTIEHLTRVHDPAYVEAVRTGVPRTLAESQGFAWDEKLWTMVLASNGGVVAAALAALREGGSGSLSSGLHHARRDSGAGFCTFNGLVVAALAAIDAGAASVLILDLDAHCGGGTASLIARETGIWQLDVSVNPFDAYDPSERLRLRRVARAKAYLGEIERGLAGLARDAPRFDLCLYNAGMDPCQDCATGGLAGITGEILAAREKLVYDWCRERGIPVAFVLAGGYVGTRLDQRGLVALHRLTLEAAARAGPAS